MTDFLGTVSTFSPRMWGCSARWLCGGGSFEVFPTYVGMFRRRGASVSSCPCFPHVCGDVPRTVWLPTPRVGFSPRMWGCSARARPRRSGAAVFPTYVGMFRCQAWRNSSGCGFPHVCGDVPPLADLYFWGAEFSPRMWGCSERVWSLLRYCPVFPTYVGMFLASTRVRGRYSSFPHVCGDVPFNSVRVPFPRAFSPRMWGCSVGC